MKAICELCGAGEPSIVGLTSAQIAAGEKCYDKLADNHVSWTSESTKSAIVEGLNGGVSSLSPSRSEYDAAEPDRY